MDIAEFKRITEQVIQDNGIPPYIPTLIVPSEEAVMLLRGIPEDMSHEVAARDWVQEMGHESKEYFLAFKVSDEEIHLEHHKEDGMVETATIRRNPEGMP
jgi:hypothetical protein